MSTRQIEGAITSMVTTLREWANRDAWLEFPTDDGDGVDHYDDCTESDIEGLTMCGCLQCVTCGAEAICAGCRQADAAGL